MKITQSASQNQPNEKTSSTLESLSLTYEHDLANAVHDSQQAFGLNKYGITLDQVPDDKYDWQLMALEESVDMNQYLVRELRRLKEENEALKEMARLTISDPLIQNTEVSLAKLKEMKAHGISY